MFSSVLLAIVIISLPELNVSPSRTLDGQILGFIHILPFRQDKLHITMLMLSRRITIQKIRSYWKTNMLSTHLAGRPKKCDEEVTKEVLSTVRASRAGRSSNLISIAKQSADIEYQLARWPCWTWLPGQCWSNQSRAARERSGYLTWACNFRDQSDHVKRL